ncbi:MAG: protoporphyrinogen oxidase, partial [Bacteroidetes bacterium]|nr:protoporphyrinogen oxidase [Bacteroidota bacterium]
MSRVVIIGGGITGLSAAWALRQIPNPPEIILLEQSKRLGGCIYTEHFNGFLMEHGPDVFLARKPEAVQLCKSLGLVLQKTNETQRRVYLRRGTTLYPIPEGLSGLVPQRIWPLISSPLLSPRGKLRMLAELVIPPRVDESDESVTDFFIRRFGQEAFSNLIKPLLSGLAGHDVEQLSIQTLLPHLRTCEINYGSLLIGVNRTSTNGFDSSFRSLPNGLSSLIDALFELNKGCVQLGQEVTEIKPVGKYWNVYVAGHAPLPATNIILAVPAWSAAKIIAPMNPNLGNLLQQISYRAGTMVHLAYHQADVPIPLNGYGHLINPDGENTISACTWSTCKLDGRAPAGHLLFRLYLRGAGLPDSDILAQAYVEMQQALQVTADPILTRIHHFPAALPQYRLGHQERIRKIQRIVRS